MEYRRNYLNVEKVNLFLKQEQEQDQDQKQNGLIKTLIYDNGLYKVIPNPLNKDRVESVKKTYESGFFIEYRIVYLPLSFINDENNYNS